MALGIGIHAGAGVGHGQQHVGPRSRGEVLRGVRLVELGVAGLDGEPAAVGHRVARVDGEVDDHLLDLAGVRLHRAEPGPECRAELDVLTDQAPQQLFQVRDEHVQVQHLGRQHLLATEGEQLAREVGGTPRGFADLFDVFPLGHLGPEGLEQQVSATEDRGEEVIEVMRDPAGEAPHGFHLLRLTELGLEQLTLGDVFDDDVEGLHAAVRVAHRAPRLADRDGLAVLAAPHRLGGEASPPSHVLDETCSILGIDVDVPRHVLREQLRRGIVTQDVHEGRVHREEPTVRGALEDPERGVLDQRPVGHLGAGQRLLRPSALDELSDLAPERRRHLEQVGVRLARLAAEELDDAGDRRRAPDRKPEGAAQARGGRVRQSGEARARESRDVPVPDRSIGPHVAWEPDASHKGHLARHTLELGEVYVRGMPDLETPQHVALAVEDPQDAGLPIQALADRA